MRRDLKRVDEIKHYLDAGFRNSVLQKQIAANVVYGNVPKYPGKMNRLFIPTARVVDELNRGYLEKV